MLVSVALPKWLVKLVPGFDNVDDYLVDYNPYFGATVGRVANRIANSTFQIDGVTYSLTKNRGEHHLHGGKKVREKFDFDSCKNAKSSFHLHIKNEDFGFIL